MEVQVVVSANVTDTSFEHVIGANPSPQVITTIGLTASRPGSWEIASLPNWTTVNLNGNIATIEFNCNVEEFEPQSLFGMVNLNFKGTGGNMVGSIAVAVEGQLVNG